MSSPEYLTRASTSPLMPSSNILSPPHNNRHIPDSQDGEMSPMARRQDSIVARNASSPLQKSTLGLTSQSALNRSNGSDSRWRSKNGIPASDNGTSDWDVTEGISRLHLSASAETSDGTSRSSPSLRGVRKLLSGDAISEADLPNHADRDVRFAGHSRDSSAGSRQSGSIGAITKPDVGQLKVFIPSESKDRPSQPSAEPISLVELHRMQDSARIPQPISLKSLESAVSRRPIAHNVYPNNIAPSSNTHTDANYPSLIPQQVRPNNPVQGHGLKVDFDLQPRHRVSQPMISNTTNQHPVSRSAVSPIVPQAQRHRVDMTHGGNLNVHNLPYDIGMANQRLDAPIQIRSPAPTLQPPQPAGYRPLHQISPIDSAALRDANALGLVNRNLQPSYNSYVLTPQISINPMLYSNQYYDTQQAFSQADIAAAMAMQLSPRMPYTDYASSLDGRSTASSNHVNNKKLGLYKTELCRSFEEKGTCKYGNKCQFAHTQDELRGVNRHPKYKTEICRTYWREGSCPYGKRCCFVHADASGAAASSESDVSAQLSLQTPNSQKQPQTQLPVQSQVFQRQYQPQQNPVARATLMSEITEKNYGQATLLSRLNGQVTHAASIGDDSEALSPAYEADTSPASASIYNLASPRRKLPLRVDTSVPGDAKQNKSAYPTFTGAMNQASEKLSSPVPVTAGPDFGRHTSSRVEIVGYKSRNDVLSSPSRSYIGDEDAESDFTPTGSNGLIYSKSGLKTPERPKLSVASAIAAHSRSGSAGNWEKPVGPSSTAPAGTTSGAARLTYPQSAHPNSQGKTASPWATSSRFNEKAWV